MANLPSQKGLRPSHLADRPTVDAALRMTLLMVQPAAKDPNVCGTGFLHMVVMTPGLTPGQVPFEDAIMLEHSIGDPATWDADYAAFARAKARLSWETGLDCSLVQALQPHRLALEDTLLYGGVCLDGIVVGVSGAHPWYDEAFAMTMAVQIRAMCKARHADLLQRQRHVATGTADEAPLPRLLPI